MHFDRLTIKLQEAIQKAQEIAMNDELVFKVG